MKNRQGTSGLFLVMLTASALTAGSVYASIDQSSVNKCKECHEDVVNSFLAGSHHGKAWSKIEGKQYSCENCHGNGDKHIAAGGGAETIISFTKKSVQTAAERSNQCLACHGKNPQLSLWADGKHQKNDVACSSCHSIHKGPLKPTVDTCFTCHKDIRSQLSRNSHHPIIEGKVACADCHNPHGALSHSMLRAENVNMLCYKCHSDKRGPYSWEHPPVEENCAICHVPHGSQHPKLLVEKLPNLCQDCHHASHQSTPYGQDKGFTGSGATQFVGRSCVNCHPQVHGSVGPKVTAPTGVTNRTSGTAFTR